MPGVNGKGGPAGFDAAKNKNLNIPDKITCEVCLKSKDRSLFSNKQVNDYRSRRINANSNLPRGKRNVQVPLVMRCNACVGQVVAEMYCHDCRVTKDLSEFAKAQRGADEAQCNACMAGRTAVEPEDHDPGVGDESDSEDDNLTAIGGSVPEGWTDTTSESNYWEMTGDGDFATENNRSEIGSSTTTRRHIPGYDPTPATTTRVIGRSVRNSGNSNLTSANVNALNRSTGGQTPIQQSYGAPSSAQYADDLAHGITNMSVQDDDDDGAWGPPPRLRANANDFPPLSGAAGNRTRPAQNHPQSLVSNTSRYPMRPAQNPPQSYTAWSHTGERAVRYGAPASSASNASSARSQQQPLNTNRPNPGSRGGRFAKIRPEKDENDEDDNGGWPKHNGW